MTVGYAILKSDEAALLGRIQDLLMVEPGWRNWQTQRTQNPPRATSWGFDPPSRHQDNKGLLFQLIASPEALTAVLTATEKISSMRSATSFLSAGIMCE
jgi:hypothetical protein